MTACPSSRSQFRHRRLLSSIRHRRSIFDRANRPSMFDDERLMAMRRAEGQAFAFQ
jgi:hypothetical protein